MNKTDFISHQSRHGFDLPPELKIEQFGKPSPVKARSMNKTEANFAEILEVRQRHGGILSFAYEGIRLKYADGLHYKADFTVLNLDKSITLIETKGGFIYPRDKVRFRACAAEWREWFDFEMWQKKSGQWSRIR